MKWLVTYKDLETGDTLETEVESESVPTHAQVQQLVEDPIEIITTLPNGNEEEHS